MLFVCCWCITFILDLGCCAAGTILWLIVGGVVLMVELFVISGSVVLVGL